MEDKVYKFRRQLFKAIILIAVFALIGLSQGLIAKASVGMGDKGDVVEEIQKKLKAWGYYDGVIDGKYGKGTVDAVKKFQKKSGINQSGKTDPETAKLMGLNVSADQDGEANVVDDEASSMAEPREDSNEIELLARFIQSQAKDLPINVKSGIGAVVLNRVKSADFPNTISGVIYQPNAFSFIDSGAKPDENSIVAAKDAMNGFDPTNGALFFFKQGETTNEFFANRRVLASMGGYTFCD